MIKIDEVKAKQIERLRFPTLTPAEFELKLLKAGLRQTVLEYIQQSEELSIVFNRATFFSRTDQFLLNAIKALNLDEDEVDKLWLS